MNTEMQNFAEEMGKEFKSLLNDQTKQTEEKFNSELVKLNEKFQSELKEKGLIKSAEDDKNMFKLLEQVIKSNEKMAQEIDSIRQSPQPKKANKNGFDFLKKSIKNYETATKSTVAFEDKGKLSLKEYFQRSPNSRLYLEADLYEVMHAKAAKSAEARGKAYDPMLTTDSLADMDANYYTTYLPKISKLETSLNTHVMEIFPNEPIMGDSMAITVEFDESITFDYKTEGVASGNVSSISFKNVKFLDFVIDTTGTFSREILEDDERIRTRLLELLPDRLMTNLDVKTLVTTGDGATAIKGFLATDYTYTFDANTYSSARPRGSAIDVIDYMITEIINRDNQPDFILMSRLTMQDIAAQMDTLENSRDDKRVEWTGGVITRICGLPIYLNNKLSDNSVYVGVRDENRFGTRRAFNIEIGYNGTDFKDGNISVIASIRIAVGSFKKRAFNYCSDLTAAVTTIRTP